MEKIIKSKSKDMCTCKKCQKPYDKKEVKRIYGSESSVYLFGFCSANCYTLSKNI